MTTRLIVKKNRGSIAAMFLLLLTATITVAQSTSSAGSSGVVPQLVKFGGVLKDDAGRIKTGMVGLTFAVYKEQDGGTPLWLETQNVEADSEGNYSVLLGSTKTEGLPAELFSNNEPRWLGVQLEGQAEQPRVLFVSVPYALRASDAATIGGLPPSAFMRAPEPGRSSENNSAVHENNASTASSTASVAPPVTGSGKTDFIPIWTSSSSLGDSTIFETGGKVGIGTTTPGPFALVVSAPNQLGEQIQGPFTGVGAGFQLQTTGAGGKGWELLATGKSSAQGPSKLNIRDLSTAADVFTIAPGGLVGINNTNPQTALQVTDNNVPCCAVGTVLAADAFKVGTAVFGDVTGTSGLSHGVFGQIFSPVTGSAAVVGEAQGVSGQTSGVSGFNRSSGRLAAGVVAAEEASSGVTLGVSAVSDSPNGTGILGLGQGQSATGGLLGCCSVGAWGDTSSNAPFAAGVVGTADDAQGVVALNNSTNNAHPTLKVINFENTAHNVTVLTASGSFGSCISDTDGNLSCTGNIRGNVVLPSQRQVALYAMQSPQNWFEDFGSGELASGTATIHLEPTFAQTVNTGSDYHVFLTPEGECRGLYVTNKSAAGFEVHELGGGRSTVAFDYRIVALRRGFESVRLEDVTDRWNKMNTSMPAPESGPRFKTPSVPPAPVMHSQLNDSGGTQLKDER